MERLTIPAKVDGLQEFCAFVHAGAEAAGLSSSQINELDLVLEELFMNVARHAYAPGQGDVEIGYEAQGPGRLLVEISDAGRAFNPLASDPPDFSLSLADRPLGGMGVFLIREMTSSLRYERDRGRNRVSFIFPAAC
jgi:anti-sigma regulatory factor (Ser/Thr protein kinase)